MHLGVNKEIYKQQNSVSRLSGMNLTSDQAVAHQPKSLREDRRRPLWAQTLKTCSEWSSPWMFQIL